MATESTADALIDLNSIPASEQANLNIVQTPSGTSVLNTGSTTGLIAFIDGPTTCRGGTLTNASFTFGSAPPQGQTPLLQITQTNLLGSSIVGTVVNELLVFGGNSFAKAKGKTVIGGTNVDMGDGADSISFANKTVISGSTFAAGQGSDSITFGKGSKASNVSIDLGQDNDADLVAIDKKGTAKSLEISNFGQGDTLRVGKKTYSYDDLQELGGSVGKNIQVDFS